MKGLVIGILGTLMAVIVVLIVLTNRSSNIPAGTKTKINYNLVDSNSVIFEGVIQDSVITNHTGVASVVCEYQMETKNISPITVFTTIGNLKDKFVGDKIYFRRVFITTRNFSNYTITSYIGTLVSETSVKETKNIYRFKKKD